MTENERGDGPVNHDNPEWVWVYCSTGFFPCGVFETREQAEHWIRKHKVAGCLTRYPLGEGIYDYVIRMSYFKPKKDYQFTSKFISRFSSAYLEHYHYEIDETTGEFSDISGFLREEYESH